MSKRISRRGINFVLAVMAATSLVAQSTSEPVSAQYRGGQRSFCPAPQYPTFSCGNPGYCQVPQRYLPGICNPGFTYGCMPYVPQVSMPFFFGPSLITETINSVEIPGSLNPDGTTRSGAATKDRIESLIPTLTNDKEIPDTTKTGNADMSSVMDGVFKTPTSKDDGDTACQTAARLCKEGKYEDALSAVDRESASSSSHICRYVHASANLGLGKLDDALKDIKQCQELNPNFAPGFFTEGSILSEQNKLQDAVNAYSKALAIRPTYVRCLDARAAAYYRLGQFIDSIKDFERALAQSPKDANALYMRGLCYFMVGQYQMVPFCYDDYLALNPNDASALANRASAYFELGKYTEALADFDKLLAIEPKYTTCLYRRCLANWHLGRWQQATADANGALALAGWHDDNSAYLALCAYLLATKAKDQVAAQKILDDSIKNLDSKPWPYPLFLYFAGRITEADLFKQAITKEQWTQARTYVAIKAAWSQAGDKSKVMALLEKVRADGASNVPEYNLAIAELFRNKVKDVTNVSRPVNNRYALVVGVSKFKDASINLRYPGKDAQDFANFLIASEGFKKENVKCLLDEQATRENILGALGENWLPRTANKEDLVLIYFSTHGSPSAMDAKGINYLVAYDTDKEMLYATGIPVQDLTRMVKDKVHADRIVVLMDACHSGSAKADDRPKIDADNMANESGQVVICSSLPEEVSWESKQYQNSVFTRHLMDGLKSKGDKTSLADTFEYTRARVEKEVWDDRKSHQTPVMKSTWTKADLAISAP